MNTLINQIKKTIVFLGTLEQKNDKQTINIKATAFLVKIKTMYHLVTAKHVVKTCFNGN